jgi:GAF domain-containing protein
MARQIGLLERARLEEEYDHARAMADRLRILHTLGMAIASAMDLEQVLTRIVEAAVFITQAEEGSLLLLDEESQDLHLRAQKGLGDKYARGFRVPVQDSLAGNVPDMRLLPWTRRGSWTKRSASSRGWRQSTARPRWLRRGRWRETWRAS